MSDGNDRYAPLPLTEGGYHAICADPPWRYNDKLPGTGRGASKHYSTLSTPEIMDLPVGDVAARDCHLYVWCTNSFLVDAHEVARAWGFEPKTLITWVKVGSAGRVRIGMGHYFRNATEHVVFAVRGKQPLQRRNIPTVFFAQRRSHSEKPEEFYDLVREASPGPRLDLFSRRAINGFDVWGLEAPE